MYKTDICKIILQITEQQQQKINEKNLHFLLIELLTNIWIKPQGSLNCWSNYWAGLLSLFDLFFVTMNITLKFPGL